jgi:hypothetical protein
MNNVIMKNQPNPLIKVVKSFFTKLVKSSDDYPIKYYKRDKNYSKVRRS